MENFDNVANTLFDRLIAETEGLHWNCPVK